MYLTKCITYSIAQNLSDRVLVSIFLCSGSIPSFLTSFLPLYFFAGLFFVIALLTYKIDVDKYADN